MHLTKAVAVVAVVQALTAEVVAAEEVALLQTMMVAPVTPEIRELRLLAEEAVLEAPVLRELVAPVVLVAGGALLVLQDHRE
jgi:hypothetical protein